MDVRRAYCSAVDRNVPVVLKSAASAAGPVSIHRPSDLVCLDYGVRCTGWMCPLYSVSDDSEPATALAAARPADQPGTDPSKPVKRWSRRT